MRSSVARGMKLARYALAVALAGACSLTNNLNDLKGGVCGGDVAMTCPAPNFGSQLCNNCIAGSCCVQIEACAKDSGCRALQACVNQRCATPNKDCATAECGDCLTGSAATAWLDLQNCSQDSCGTECGIGDGGVVDAKSDAPPNCVPHPPQTSDAGDAVAPSGDAGSCGGGVSLGLGGTCDGCAASKCCNAVDKCTKSADCWGFWACTVQKCVGQGTFPECSNLKCSDCSAGLTLTQTLVSCLEASCNTACL